MVLRPAFVAIRARNPLLFFAFRIDPLRVLFILRYSWFSAKDKKYWRVLEMKSYAIISTSNLWSIGSLIRLKIYEYIQATSFRHPSLYVDQYGL